ncbi:helix-turn-helix domain-containing protein [[Clostridium] innocuum]|nr:helix-turn-helix domain-containing protein [[Clostridium] innocuum]
MNVNDKIKMLRTEHQLSQESLAALLDVSRQSVSKWEKGLSKPSSENLARLAEIFSVHIQDLMKDSIQLERSFHTTHFFTDMLKKKAFLIPFCMLIVLFIIMFLTGVLLRYFKMSETSVIIVMTISAVSSLSAAIMFISVILRFVYMDCRIRNIPPLRYVLLSITLPGLIFYLLYRDELSQKTCARIKAYDKEI